MFGTAVLLVTAVCSAIGALSILGHPGGLWLALALIALANVVVLVGVRRRQVWARWLAIILFVGEGLAASGAVLYIFSVASAIGGSFGIGILLVVVVFAVFIGGLSLLAINSINNLEWPDR